MELTYKLTRAEYQHMASTENQRNPKLRAQRALVALIVPLFALLATYLLTNTLIAGVIAAAIIMALSPARLCAGRSGRATAPCTTLTASAQPIDIRIDDRCLYISRDHIRFRGSTGKRSRRWRKTRLAFI